MILKKVAWIVAYLLIIIISFAGCGGGSRGGGKPTPTPTPTPTPLPQQALLPTPTPIPGTGRVSGNVSFAVGGGTFMNQSNDINYAFIRAMSNNQMRNTSVPNEKIIKVRPGLSDKEVELIVKNMGGKIKRKIYGTMDTYVININTGSFSASMASKNSDVISIEENYLFYATVVPNDPQYAEYQAWNYEMLNLPSAWALQKGNSNIIVAVVDTGVSLNHPDLSYNLVPGWDFVENDSSPCDIIYYNNSNRYSHGTHVAGIISAITDNGLDVAGVAWNVKIMPIRVLGPDGSGSIDNVIAGINWAVDHGAKVINLSMGGSNSTETLHTAIINAVNKGVTVVAAAGNDGGPVCYPAKYEQVIAVSALGPTKTIAAYSNRGPEIDVCAPGGEYNGTPKGSMIFSITYDKLNRQNGFVYMDGTSQACPHIAGLAALLYSRGMTSVADIRARIEGIGNIEDLGNPGVDDLYGKGLPIAGNVIKGAPYGITAVKVFYGLKNGTYGTFFDADGSGNYKIINIPPGETYICAFIDKDNDGNVSEGDSFGFCNSHVDVPADDEIPNIDFTLTTVDTGINRSLKDYLIDVLGPLP